MGGEPSRPFDLVNRGPEGDGATAALTATLEGDGEQRCVWLVPEPGSVDGVDAQGRVSVVWPSGFTARTKPIRVYRGNGELVATEGDLLRFGGGFGPPHTKSESRCVSNRVSWWVTDVELAPELLDPPE